MGMLGNMGMDQVPQITPDIMASMGGAAPQLPQLPPQMPAAPMQAQQQPFAGLKRPPPPVGTVQNGFKYMGGDPRSQDPSVWAPVTGDEFLGSVPLDEDKKTLIKMMANYEAPASGNRGIGSPEVQQLVSLAKRYDPTFDIKNYKVRQDYLKDLNGMKANGTIQSLSNAAMHLKSYDDEFQKLGNSDWAPEWFNSAKQRSAALPLIGGLFGGSDRLKAASAAKTDATIAAPEIARVSMGGSPNEHEIMDQRNNLGAGSWMDHSIGIGPSDEAGTMSAMAQKIGDRMLSMQAQYRRAFGNHAPKEPLITPEAATAVHQLLKRYSPDYESKLDYTMLTAGGFSPQQAKGMATQQPPPASGAGGPPSGVDAKTWSHMTPQEKSLWGH